MRRLTAAAFALALLCLGACSAGEYQNLRLFCEEFGRFAVHEEGLARITPEQFFVEVEDETKYCAYLGQTLYLTCNTLPNGRVHTVALTALPETTQREFTAASLCLLQAYTKAAADQAERWLGQLHANEAEILGVQGFEAEGYRFSYAANAAGRYLRVSRLQLLPPEPELATLRETIAGE